MEEKKIIVPVRAIHLSETGIHEWLWESIVLSTCVFNGKRMFGYSEDAEITFCVKWYPNSVIVLACEDADRRFLQNKDNICDQLKEQLMPVDSFFCSGSEEDQRNTPYRFFDLIVANNQQNVDITSKNGNAVIGMSTAIRI